jgi:hypothetical protein
VSPLDKRLGEIERLLAKVERDWAGHRLDPFAMTDAEAVEACRWFNTARRGDGWQPRRTTPAEEAAMVAAWRELNRR